MSEKLCPYCGSEPNTIVEFAFCPNRECPIGMLMMGIEDWNRRFVCLDKNGDKVFAGDEAKGQTDGGWNRGKVLYSKPYWCYGLRDADGFHKIFGEIELINKNKTPPQREDK